MTQEVREFLDGMYAYEEICGPFASAWEAAGTIQFWREDGIEVPDGLRAGDLYQYVAGLWAEKQKAEKPLKVWRIRVGERLSTSVYIEAHNAEEAETLLDTCVDMEAVSDRILASSPGWEFGVPVEVNDCDRESIDLTWEDAKRSGYFPESEES